MGGLHSRPGGGGATLFYKKPPLCKGCAADPGVVAYRRQDGGVVKQNNPPVSYADSPLCTRGPKEWVKAFPVWGFVADPEVYHYK